MNKENYAKAKIECLERLKRTLNQSRGITEVFDYTFDCAYTLGKETETISQEDVEKVAEKYAERAYYPVGQSDCHEGFHMEAEECLAKAFKSGANFALGKQEKNEKKSKRMCLRDKSKVCNLCHECDTEADEWYSMSR